MRTPEVCWGERVSLGTQFLFRVMPWAVQLVLHRFPGEPGVRQVQQEQVIVRAAGDHLVAHGDKFIAHDFAVADNGVDVFPELFRGGLLRL